MESAHALTSKQTLFQHSAIRHHMTSIGQRNPHTVLARMLLRGASHTRRQMPLSLALYSAAWQKGAKQRRCCDHEKRGRIMQTNRPCEKQLRQMHSGPCSSLFLSLPFPVAHVRQSVLQDCTALRLPRSDPLRTRTLFLFPFLRNFSLPSASRASRPLRSLPWHAECVCSNRTKPANT